MNTLFFAFAPSSEPGQELPNLVEEEEAIRKILRSREQEGEYHADFLSYGSLQRIISRLYDYRDDLVWFHFSGHANKHNLLLKDKETKGEGILHLLKQCPKLKGVVLNGCSTQWQAAQLRLAGIPVVIGTSSLVEDEKAKEFSIGFYDQINRGKSVTESFEMAIGGSIAQGVEQIYRGGYPPDDEEEEASLWGILTADEEAKKLKLPFSGESLEELKSRLKKSLSLDLGKTLNELYDLVNDNSSKQNLVIQILGQFNTNKKRENAGLAYPQDIAITNNRIRNAATSLVNELEKDDLR